MQELYMFRKRTNKSRKILIVKVRKYIYSIVPDSLIPNYALSLLSSNELIKVDNRKQ